MADVTKHTLGRTGLEVTMMGYGAMELRGAPRGREVSAQQAHEILNAVLDAGINFIDTSIDYGQSEEFIGTAISHRRSEYFLASKCGCLVGATTAPERGRFPHEYTRKNIVAGVEQSLRRMKVEYLDLVQVHGGPPKSVLAEHEVVGTLVDLKQQGKVRYIGMSSTLPDLDDHIAMGAFDTFQIPYSALQRDHEEVITRAAQAGAGIIIRGGATRGAPADGRQQGPGWELWQKARLDELLDGMSRMEFIMRFTFTHPDLHTNIVGTINPEHLQSNLDALHRGPLPADVYDEAKRRLASEGAMPKGA